MKKKNILLTMFAILIVILVLILSLVIYNKLNNRNINDTINNHNTNDTIDNHNLNDTKKLVVSISYVGIKCPTPTLKLYEDNTYEFTGACDGQTSNGVYSYDINKIIDNNDKYTEVSDITHYAWTDSQGSLTKICVDNKELKELLNEINIKLDVCACY